MLLGNHKKYKRQVHGNLPMAAMFAKYVVWKCRKGSGRVSDSFISSTAEDCDTGLQTWRKNHDALFW